MLKKPRCMFCYTLRHVCKYGWLYIFFHQSAVCIHFWRSEHFLNETMLVDRLLSFWFICRLKQLVIYLRKYCMVCADRDQRWTVDKYIKIMYTHCKLPLPLVHGMPSCFVRTPSLGSKNRVNINFKWLVSMETNFV